MLVAATDSLRVLVTGADGFVGRHMQQILSQHRVDYRVAVRRQGDNDDPRRVVVGDMGPSTDWRAALEGTQVVVHLAGRAHILRETAADPRAEFMRVNAEATGALAAAAHAAGVRRLVYVSSIGVYGSASGNAPFSADSPLHPHNAYAQSKLAGEVAARAAGGTQLEVVVLRVPLVYGSGVGANFLRLVRWVDRGRPIPLGAVRNRRSFVSVWNLCDLLLRLLTDPQAPARVRLVSDGEDLSTAELVRRIGTTMGRRARIVWVPEVMLRSCAALLGRGAEMAALCSSLQLDITSTCRELKWTPPLPVNEGLARTISWYLSTRGASDA